MPTPGGRVVSLCEPGPTRNASTRNSDLSVSLQAPAVRGLPGGGLPPPAMRKRPGPCMGQPADPAASMGVPAAPQTTAMCVSRDQDPYAGVDGMGCDDPEGFGGQATPPPPEDTSPRVRRRVS